MIVIVDNYDSFTYNLYQAIAPLAPVCVVKNDVSLAEIEALQPTGIILSPGPGRPEDAGLCIALIHKLGPTTPLLGVCLGHQAIGAAFGATVRRSAEIVHGKESLIFHNRQKLFKKMKLPFAAGRYHSLLVENLPAELAVDAETADGLIMAMHHRSYPIFGVQFHPESILTPEGKQLLQNFVEMCR